MSKLPIDLTGSKGLAPHFYGDRPYIASRPNLRYQGQDGQMAEGIFNPFTFFGYMAPANNTTKACTGTTSFLLSSGLVIPSRLAVNSTDAIFFSDESTGGTAHGKVVNLDTATDTSLDTILTLSGAEAIPTFHITYGTATIDGIGVGILVNPSGSTMPTVASAVQGEAASGSSITKSVTVSGANKALYVLAWNRDPTTVNNATGATWDGNAMTSVSFGTYSPSGGVKIAYSIFRYTAPASITGDVVVSWAGSENNLGVICIVVNDANQTTPFTGNTIDTESNAAEFQFTIAETGSNQLRLVTFLTETTTHSPSGDWQTEVLNDTDTSGRFSTWKFTLATQFSRLEDMVVYQINVEPKILFTKRNTVSDNFNSIGIADLDFSNVDEDWSYAIHNFTLSGSNRATFVRADNNTLYVLDGASVHSIDGTVLGGTNGSITEDVLQFLGGGAIGGDVARVIDGVDTRGRIWFGVHIYANFDARENSFSGITTPQFIGVYVWDRISGVAGMQDYVSISGAKEFKSMHLLGNEPACFTISTEGYTQLRKWDGSGFAVVQTLGKLAYPNFQKHSVYEDGQSIMWLGNDGKVYVYGRLEGNDVDALYIIGDMEDHITAASTFTESGVLIPANATETVTSGNEPRTLGFYLSFSDSGGNHLKKWYPYGFNEIATVAQKAKSGDVYSKVELLPGMSQVNDLVVRCAPTDSAGSTTIATIKVYLNNSATAFVSKSVTTLEASRGYVRVPLNGKKPVNTIQIEIEWSESETLSKDTFLPYMAILDYTETNIKEK